MKQTWNIICIVVISSVMSSTAFSQSRATGSGFLLEVNFFPTLSAKNNTNNILASTSLGPDDLSFIPLLIRQLLILQQI